MAGKFIEDDLDTIFSERDFGHKGGVIWNGVTIKGAIFDDQDVEVQMGEGMVQIIAQPMVTGPSSAFDGIRHEDTISVGDQSFTVKSTNDNGTGVIEIYMEKVL